MPGRPYQDVRIRHSFVLDDPYPDPPQLDIPPASPERLIPEEETVKRRIPYETNLDEAVDSRTEEELDRSIKRKEAQSRAIVLEMTGDIPDAEAKPPVEVLFVCKLNPVTRDEDLELIFSRYGTIKQCEIIRDHKTGDSLNYAFIEFESESSCIEAYDKMNNALIDDRRIKVDFSQSVSKLWNRFMAAPRQNGNKRPSAAAASSTNCP
jgi:peptidyl-prolyl cis-trans isomerase-like 4